MSSSSFKMKNQNNKPQLIVVKVGTTTLTDDNGCIDRAFIANLVNQLVKQVKRGAKCVLVTSGAIRAGCERLNISTKSRTMPEKQAAAAVGQGLLLHTYTEMFDKFGITAAQVLLTKDDFGDRGRYLNARNTLNTLLRLGCVPIINENDTVAVEEIRFGDNDTLAAMVASVLGADLLILLSDVSGLFDGSPDAPESRLISEVRRMTPQIRAFAGESQSGVGSGGMRTKLDAAEMCMRSGVQMVIAHGRLPNVIEEVVDGKQLGTRFIPSAKLSHRKRWIAHSSVRGTVVVNEGARKMVAESGKSLLPAGIVDVVGGFGAGAVVDVKDEKGERFARGIVNYSADDIRRIMGLRTSEIERVLGTGDYEEVIHRDNMVIGV